MKILISEDDATTRQFLEALLEKKGYEVVSTENGEEAWLVMQMPNAPRLLLVDWLMPKMDGGELCRRIRSLEGEVQPHIIMLTIKREKTDIVAGLEAGADDYLVKPYDPGELFARINVGMRILNLQDTLVNRLEALRKNEEKIQGLLAEKELILKEVHHRIKNNMTTIYGLLILQAGHMTDPLAQEALEDAGSRVQSMMLLYKNLYQSVSFNEISAALYFPSLVDEILAAFPEGKSVKVKKNIEDFILPAKKLQPLGIIVNELLTNIMKYAFTGKREAIITVLATVKENRINFVVEDNGIGMPESIDFTHSPGFGLVLVGELAKQLNGKIRIERGNGTKIILEFEK